MGLDNSNDVHSTNRAIKKHDEAGEERHVVSVLYSSPCFQQQAREEYATYLKEAKGLEIVRAVFFKRSQADVQQQTHDGDEQPDRNLRYGSWQNKDDHTGKNELPEQLQALVVPAAVLVLQMEKMGGLKI